MGIQTRPTISVLEREAPASALDLKSGALLFGDSNFTLDRGSSQAEAADEEEIDLPCQEASGGVRT